MTRFLTVVTAALTSLALLGCADARVSDPAQAVSPAAIVQIPEKRAFCANVPDAGPAGVAETASPPMNAGNHGREGYFVGTLDLRFCGDGRHWKLLHDYTYVDGKGHAWVVPRNWIVDGASIPQLFWSKVGGPWDGPYVSASVIHDYLCDVKNEPWPRVHRVFYWAMIANHVPEKRALLLYAAVQHFGPRWKDRVGFPSRTADFVHFIGNRDVPLPPPPQPGTPGAQPAERAPLPALPEVSADEERPTQEARAQQVDALAAWVESGALRSPDDVDESAGWDWVPPEAFP